MATTTTASLHYDTTEMDEYIWWHIFGCDTVGRQTFTIIFCLFIVLQMIFVLYITYTLIKNKPKSMAMTLFYLIFSQIYYIDAIIMHLNQCFGRNDDVQEYGWYIRIICYLLGFIILIFMWFHRLYIIFKAGAYPLSKLTIVLFAVYIVTGCIVVILILITVMSHLTVVVNMLNLVGLSLVIVGVLALPGLYIRKLYMIMNSKKSEQGKANKFKLALLKSTSKNIILTAFTLFGSFLTVIISATLTIFISHVDQFWVRKVQLTILLVDHTTNILGYILGFAYTKDVYHVLCGCLDKPVTERIANRVNLAVSVAHENLATNSSKTAQNIQPLESTMTTTNTAT